MPRPKSANDIQLTVNVSEAIRDRIDALTEPGASMPGAVLTRSDVMRSALVEGLAVLEQRFKGQHAPAPSHHAPPRKR